LDIIISDLYSKINCSADVITLLKDILRHENDYMSRKSSNFKIPRFNYLISDSGVFLTGHVDLVTSFLKEQNLNFTVVDNRKIKEPPPVDEILARLSHLDYSSPPIKLRDYQADAVIKGLERTVGLFHIATGGGKTLTMSTLILAWSKKTLVVVSSKDLAKQLRDEIENFTGRPVGLIGDGFFKDEEITVGMTQSLTGKSSSAKDKKLREFLESIEYIVCDEAHHTQAKTWRAVLKKCKNASIRHGFTATPLTSKVKGEDGETSNLDILLSGYLGPIICKVTTKDLIDRGFLAKPSVVFIKNEVYFDGEPLQYSEEYDRIISKDEERNKIICQLFKNAWESGKQTIGFVLRVSHGEEIAQMLINQYGIPEEDIGFAHGSLISSAREEMIDSFKAGNLKILFGTVLNEGLNFFCDVGINIAGGDSEKIVIQRLGRILRKGKTASGDVDTSTCDEVVFFDFEDKGHPFFSKHSKNRKKVYKAEGHEVSSMSLDLIDGGIFK